jgi:WD40 repeat protein
LRTTYTMIPHLECNSHQNSSNDVNDILYVTCNLADTMIAVCAATGYVYIYAVDSDNKKYQPQVLHAIHAHPTAECVRCTFNSSGTKLLTIGTDGRACIFNTSTGECIQTLKDHQHNELTSCAWSYDGDVIVTSSKDNKCCIYRSLNDSIKQME